MNRVHEIWKMYRPMTSRNSRNPNSRLRSFAAVPNVVFVLAALLCTTPTKSASAHGFNANHVDIVKTFGRKYRVIIKYTHVEVGEYREAHVDFDKKEDAIKVFQDLAKGADFFLGDVKNSIHFHNPPETNKPF
jgi:uncharacterized protein YktB (UPF0637 family)